eukprot:2503215-Amphidinium_carterae.1
MLQGDILEAPLETDEFELKELRDADDDEDSQGHRTATSHENACAGQDSDASQTLDSFEGLEAWLAADMPGMELLDQEEPLEQAQEPVPQPVLQGIGEADAAHIEPAARCPSTDNAGMAAMAAEGRDI